MIQSLYERIFESEESKKCKEEKKLLDEYLKNSNYFTSEEKTFMTTYNCIQPYIILKSNDDIINEIDAYMNEHYNPIISVDPMFYCYKVNDIMLTRKDLYTLNDGELRDMICHLNTGIQSKLYTDKEEIEKTMKKLVHDKDQIFELLCSDYVYKEGRLNNSMKDGLYKSVIEEIRRHNYNIQYNDLMNHIEHNIKLVNLLNKKRLVWKYLIDNKYIQNDYSGFKLQ
jgi:hypothetical protein